MKSQVYFGLLIREIKTRCKKFDHDITPIEGDIMRHDIDLLHKSASKSERRFFDKAMWWHTLWHAAALGGVVVVELQVRLGAL